MAVLVLCVSFCHATRVARPTVTFYESSRLSLKAFKLVYLTLKGPRWSMHIQVSSRLVLGRLSGGHAIGLRRPSLELALLVTLSIMWVVHFKYPEMISPRYGLFLTCQRLSFRGYEGLLVRLRGLQGF